MICYISDKEIADKFSKRIEDALGIPITINLVSTENVVRDTMQRLSEILNSDGKKFQQILMNISSGSKIITCAALSAAFINGIKVFGMDEITGSLLPMPVIKLSYSETISKVKIKILKEIYNAGGIIENLEQLLKISGYGKPMLSYHIRGDKDSKGLIDMGLLEVKKGERGKITSVKLTPLATLLISSKAIDLI